MTSDKKQGKAGAITLPLFLLMTLIVVELAIAGLVTANALNNSFFGERLGAEALHAAKSGAQDAILKVVRSCPISNCNPANYTVTVGPRNTADVSISRDGTTGDITITSTGTAFTRKKTVQVFLAVNQETGEVRTRSFREVAYSPSPPPPPLSPPPPPGGGTGLTGAYYDEKDFTGETISRVDPTVDFDWGSGKPAPEIDEDKFSVRWLGQVKALYSESYTFYTVSSDGVRLWVNNQLIIDDWRNHSSAFENTSNVITLTAGQRYDIKLEYYEDTSIATIRLSWSSASQAKEIIPQSQLYP